MVEDDGAGERDADGRAGDDRVHLVEVRSGLAHIDDSAVDSPRQVTRDDRGAAVQGCGDPVRHLGKGAADNHGAVVGHPLGEKVKDIPR
jgi:hypothetical protein